MAKQPQQGSYGRLPFRSGSSHVVMDEGHADTVVAVAICELNGRPIIVSAGDWRFRVWDPFRLTEIREIHAGPGRLTAVDFDQVDGRPVAVGAGSEHDRDLIYTLKMFDLSTGNAISGPMLGHMEGVDSVALGWVDDRLTLISCDGSSLCWWDTTTGALIDEFDALKTRSIAIKRFDDRAVVAGACWDGSVRLWDAGTRVPIGEPLVGHIHCATDVALARIEGRAMVVSASSGRDGTVRRWDLNSGAPIGEPLVGHTGDVLTVTIGKFNGRPVVASGSADLSIRLWDAGTGAPIGKPMMGHTGSVSAVAIGRIANRTVVVSGAYDQTVRLWDPFRC